MRSRSANGEGTDVWPHGGRRIALRGRTAHAPGEELVEVGGGVDTVVVTAVVAVGEAGRHRAKKAEVPAERGSGVRGG